MRSFKKIFWSGLFSLFVIWLIYKLGEILYNFPGSLRNLLTSMLPEDIPGLKFIAVFMAVFIIIMILGVVTYLISLTSSKIPFISQIVEFSKTAYDLSEQISKGEVKSVLVKTTPGRCRPGYTRNETFKTDDQELIKVFLPNTPNFTSGQTHFVTREQLIYLPKELNKPILKTITSGGLLK